MRPVLWLVSMAGSSCLAMLLLEAVEKVSGELFPALWLSLWAVTTLSSIGALVVFFRFCFSLKKRDTNRRFIVQEPDWTLGHSGVRR
jgi:hypothetical protein